MENKWITDDFDYFEFLRNNDPVRKGVFLRQIKADCKSTKMFISILLILGSLIFGIIKSKAIFLLLPIIGLSLYLKMFYLVTKGTRYAPLLLATVDSIREKHPTMKTVSLTDAVLNDGKVVPVSLDKSPAEKILQSNKEIEVAILYTPSSECSQVIAMRPANQKT